MIKGLSPRASRWVLNKCFWDDISVDELKARIVKLRLFSGMNHDEIAALLELNEKTVRRHWSLAKLWLYQQVRENE